VIRDGHIDVSIIIMNVRASTNAAHPTEDQNMIRTKEATPKTLVDAFLEFCLEF